MTLKLELSNEELALRIKALDTELSHTMPDPITAFTDFKLAVMRHPDLPIPGSKLSENFEIPDKVVEDVMRDTKEAMQKREKDVDNLTLLKARLIKEKRKIQAEGKSAE